MLNALIEAEAPGAGARHYPEGLEAVARDVDLGFELFLRCPDGPERRLVEAMRYSAMGGGKRLRPLLVQATARLFGVPRDRALRAGLAVEAVHVQSLIHDDLPCMDDDDLRRGRPTAHRAFDEATALLAGDALLALAFEILADRATHPDPEVRSDLILSLAHAAGADGMAGGQMIDMLAPGLDLDLAAVANLQKKKTGALIGWAVEAGARLGGAGAEARRCLAAYAERLGLVFQIADDLLDHEGDEARAGKRVGKDIEAGKASFVSLLGPERARGVARGLIVEARSNLYRYGREASALRSILEYALSRDR